jgi:hypothetical protein
MGIEPTRHLGGVSPVLKTGCGRRETTEKAALPDSGRNDGLEMDRSVVTDSRLLAVADAWDQLPEAIKLAILAIVKTTIV